MTQWLVEWWWREVPELSWQVALLVTLVLGASHVARRWPPQARYLMWMLVVARLLVPVGLSSPWGVLDEAESGRYVPASPRLALHAGNGPALAERRLAGAEPPAGVTSRQVDRFDPRRAAVLAWAFGAALLIVALACRYVRSRRHLAGLPQAPLHLTRTCERLCGELGLSQHVEVKVAERVSAGRRAVPAVFGLLRPIVVLPRDMVEAWSEEEIEPVLVHELLHIRRGDTWINLLQGLIRAVYFFHPMVWLAHRQIEIERELACDDAVVTYYRGRPDRYLGALFKVASTYRDRGPMPAVVALARRRAGLGPRMTRLAASRGSAAPQAVATTVLCCVALAAGSIAARRPSPDPSVAPAFALGPPTDDARAAVAAPVTGAEPTPDVFFRLMRGEESLETVLRWIAEHPRSLYTADASAALDPLSDTALVDQAMDLWLAQIETHGDDGEIYGQAGLFLLPVLPEIAEHLLERAVEIEPDEPQWPLRQANLFRQTQRPRQALAAQQRALSLSEDPRERLLVLEDLPDLALGAGELEAAGRYAVEILHAAEQTEKETASYLRHRAHVTLGRLALRADSIAEAKAHLMASAEVDGSRRLQAFGPRMTLAQELLEVGERQAVTKYLEVCGLFWERGREDLQRWIETLDRGETPDLYERSAGC